MNTIEATNRAWFPDYRSAPEEYLAYASGILRPGSRVVHLGAGRDLLGVGRRMTGCEFISVDCDGVGLALNPNPNKIKTDGSSLPFPDGSVDLVMCEHVFEHLEKPVEVLRECARVLKPGGQLLFLTPNGWSYIALGARLTPYSFHVRYKRMMTEMAEVDTFATFYRINTRSRISEIARDAGLRVDFIESRVGWPTYWEVSRLLYPVGLCLHWLLERGPAMFHISLFGSLVKPNLKTERQSE